MTVVTSGCCASHSPNESAERVGNRSMTWLRSKSTSMVPKVWPLHHAQSSTPRTRITRGKADQRAAPFDSADQRVRAERHPEPAHQALAGTSSQGATHHSDNLIGSLGLSCVRDANIEGTFGKDSPLATGIAATPATDMHSEDHRSALDRKVLQRTPIAAMARARNGLATRTDS